MKASHSSEISASQAKLSSDFLYRRPDLLQDVRYRVYSDGFHAALLSAMTWEHERRNAQISAIIDQAKLTKLKSYYALLHWATKTMEAEMKYGRLINMVVSTDHMQKQLEEQEARRQRDLDEVTKNGS